jgi:putative membrane protein
MKRKKIEILILLVIVVIAVVAGCKKQEPVNDTAPVATITAVDTTPTGGTVATATIALTAPDKQFILDAATAILAETAYSKTADALSPDVAVKALGHLMINHFADMLAELTALGQKHDLILPTEIEIKVVAANDALAKMKGKEFDRTFLQHIIDDHIAMLVLFDAESKVVSDADLRAWVDKNRPILQGHLDKAKELMTKVGK